MKVTANYSKRTFTIRKDDGTKYRTVQLSREEFNSCLNNTGNDWSQYAKIRRILRCKQIISLESVAQR